MEFSIIIPTSNRSSILLLTIENTIKIADKFTINYEIIVVNDGDTAINLNNEKITIVNNPKQGVASARNYGVSLSRSENILFLDDDILLTSDAFERIINFLRTPELNSVLNICWSFPPELLNTMMKRSFGRFLTGIKYTEMKGWMKDGTWKENIEYSTENLASYCLAIKKKTFNTIGGYNEVFPHAGFEDLDFSQRAKTKGIVPLLNTKLRVWHNETDRINPREWFKRRFREGVTRAVYVNEMKDRSLAIKPGLIKSILYLFILWTAPLIIFLSEIANPFPFLDIITHPFYKAITGAELFSGYSSYVRKN